MIARNTGKSSFRLAVSVLLSQRDGEPRPCLPSGGDGENQVTVHVAQLGRAQIDRLPKRTREVVEYRKSGLSLNHIQGCPLDCAYCIRHTYGLWDQRSRSGGRPRGNDEWQRARRGPGADQCDVFRDHATTIDHCPEFPAGRWLRPPTPGGRPDPIAGAAS